MQLSYGPLTKRYFSHNFLKAFQLTDFKAYLIVRTTMVPGYSLKEKLSLKLPLG